MINKRHQGREHSLMSIILVNIVKNPLYFINILNQTPGDQKTNSSKITLYKHHYV